jgi:hypothetical protein
MFAMPGLRGFAVSADKGADNVSCNARGVFVGHIPLLEEVGRSWRPRRTAELNQELTDCYRLPVDITAKANALALIAHALNRSDLAIAAIAAVQMQIPDPPRLAKGQEKPEDIARRARELAHSGLLKVWEPEEHPRTGTPPNPGWFAPVDGSQEQGIRVAVKPGSNNPWNEFPDAEGGGGGEPDSSSDRQQTDLPFGSKLPLQLAPFVPGGKTSGILRTPAGEIPLQSGTQGPAADMPPGSLGFDGYTKTHVEGQAAALMRQQGINDATLLINNPKICDRCTSLLPRMLPAGAILRVILPSGTVTEFKGLPQ